MSVKRQLESTSEQSVKKVRVNMDADLVEQRILIKSFEVGPIIGKSGCNVNRIRNDASVFASILKTDHQNLPERILSLKGELSNVCDAVKIVADVLIENLKKKNLKGESKDSDSETICLKLLCHKFQVGGVIGKGGELIKKTNEATGARLQVSNEPLGNSTDKSISITGTADVVAAAAAIVLQQLQDNPLKTGTSTNEYVPSPQGQMMGFQGPPQYRQPQQQQYQPYGQQQFQPPQQQQPQYAAPQQAFGAQQTGSQYTQSITIPTVCASSVIGRGGSIIGDIKRQSGTFISIAKPEASAMDKRVVDITGNSQGIQVAISLIRNVVENYSA